MDEIESVLAAERDDALEETAASTRLRRGIRGKLRISSFGRGVMRGISVFKLGQKAVAVVHRNAHAPARQQ